MKKKKWSGEKVKEFGEYDMQSSYDSSVFERFAKERKIIDITPVQRPFLVYLVRYKELEQNEKT